MRYKHKTEAFKTAKALEPMSKREKVEGFVLLVGANSEVLPVGDDRDFAISQAKQIVSERDTVVFLSKLQSKFGDVFVTKDQLVLTRRVSRL